MYVSAKALRDLINEQLNSNPDGIIFDTTLFNSQSKDYKEEFDNSDGANVDIKEVVPAHIVEIVGDYINIPNTEVTENTIAMEFDIMIRDYTTLRNDIQEQYKSVDYIPTMNAISELRRSLLANYFPLGITNLYFGGEDSNASLQVTAVPFDIDYIKFDIDNKSDGDEILLTFDGYLTATNATRLYKDNSGNIKLLIDNSQVLSIPLVIGEQTITVTKDASNLWTLSDGTNSDTVTYTFSLQSTQYYIGYTDSTFSGLDGILKELVISDTANITTPQVRLYDFDDRYSLTNVGTYATIDLGTEVNNCILWGEDGNAIFGFETLVPISEIRWNNDGIPRQLFGLVINSIISKDLIFGNLTEYSIRLGVGETDADYTPIFPVDKQLSYSAELNAVQYINDRFATGIAEENAKDFTKTFFYKPEKRITQLLKQTVGNSEEQNKSYKLKIQYPFFSETYDVLVDGGGFNANINQLSTLTVTLKQQDDSISV